MAMPKTINTRLAPSNPRQMRKSSAAHGREVFREVVLGRKAAAGRILQKGFQPLLRLAGEDGHAHLAGVIEIDYNPIFTGDRNPRAIAGPFSSISFKGKTNRNLMVGIGVVIH